MAISLIEFEKALSALAEALIFYDNTKEKSTKIIARDACIQRFEFCIELAWKTAGKIIGSSSTAANLVIRELARNELIDNPETWLDFIKARNLTSHSYDEKVATVVFDSITKFYPEAKKLLQKLKSK